LTADADLVTIQDLLGHARTPPGVTRRYWKASVSQVNAGDLGQ